MVNRNAPERGASALAALAASAAGQGGGLAGAEPLASEPLTDEQATADPRVNEPAIDDEESGEEGDRRSEPDAADEAPQRATGPAPRVSEDLAAIALEADGLLGPLLVNAISIARGKRPLQRAYVKNLEVETGPDTFEPLRSALGESHGQLSDFRRLAGLLFVELSAVDPSLDPRKGGHDAPHLLAALRELMEMCQLPPSFRPSGAAGSAGAAPGLAAAMATLGSSLGAALGSHMPKADKEDKKEERVSVKYVLDLQEAYNTRPNGETRVELYEIANRTLVGHFREALKNGVFPVDSLVSPDRMAPFASPTGAFSATDDPSMELNPKTGKVEDVSRDPKAAVATSSEEYLAKVRIFFMTIAVMLHGVKCSKAPYLVKGHEAEDFCSLSVCNEFLKFTATQGKVPLTMLRSIMEFTLQEIAQAANARVGERKSFTMAIREGAGAAEVARRASEDCPACRGRDLRRLELGGGNAAGGAEGGWRTDGRGHGRANRLGYRGGLGEVKPAAAPGQGRRESRHGQRGRRSAQARARDRG